MKKSGHRPLDLFVVVFTLIGGIFLVIGLITGFSNFSFEKEAQKAPAQITNIESYRDSDGDRRYLVEVLFTVDGEQYEGPLGFYSSGMYVGQEVEVLYDPYQPSNFRISGFGGYLFSVIFGGIGLIFFLIGISMLIFKLSRGSRKKKLIAGGDRIHAEIAGIELNRSYSVNRRHPYQIRCKWTDPRTGVLYLFTSDNLWFDPTDLIESRNITTLPIYLDMDNYKHYYIFTDDLEGQVVSL